MKLLFSLLVLLALAVVSSGQDFDFYYFVQQWPGSFCDTDRGCCIPDTWEPVADFGIHGLWPNYAQCRPRGAVDALDIVGRRREKCWPEYCNDEPLRVWQVRGLLRELHANWPTLKCTNGESGRSFDFWSHEWDRHGTCSDLDQHSYFRSSLDIKARYNLTEILANAEIVPSDDKTYTLSSIRNAIEEGTGYRANLKCNRNPCGETQLFEVYLCVDLDGKSLINCPVPMRGNCNGEIKFPASRCSSLMHGA